MARKNPVSLTLCCYYTITQGDAVMCIVDFAAKHFMTGGVSMKKYAVMVLAVVLVGVMAAVSWAVLVRFKTYENYVGEEANAEISVLLFNSAEVTFRVTEGELPPNCYLEETPDDRCKIRGKPTVAGDFLFTVRATVQYDDGTYDVGSTQCRMTVLPARNTSNDDPAPISDDIGGNTSKDIPAPGPISQDTPVPTPKPEALSTIAQALGITPDNVSYISSSDMAAPQAPTSRITNALAALSLDVISTQGSLNVSQSGYYAFPLTVPADLVGTDTELEVYLADRSVFGESSFSPSAITKSLTTAQIFTESGGTVTTLPGTIIAAADLAADTARTFSTHIVMSKTTTDPTPKPDPEPTPGTSSGGGGCSSFPAVLALTLVATTLTKSRH